MLKDNFIFKNIYSRSNLSAKMNYIVRFPMTVIDAPMGYGKSTAIREFLNENSYKSVGITLLDDGTMEFWKNFCSVMEKIESGISAQLMAIGFPTDKQSLRDCLTIFEAIEFHNHTILVLDDYHLLNSGKADEFFLLLAKRQIPNLHIILSSRVGFEGNIEELVLKGLCLVITRNDLEFNEDDILEYYKACGVKVNRKIVKDIYSYTEGWISAIYLCMLSIIEYGRYDVSATIDSLVEKTIYSLYSPKIKDFLNRICIFEFVTVQQCDFILQNANVNAQTILDKLSNSNAFIHYNPIDKTYRAHNVFTGFLRGIFNKNNTQEERNIIYKRSGMWFFEQKDYLHAMEFFAKAEAYDELLDAMEKHKNTYNSYDFRKRISEYFYSCPLEVRNKHPYACLMYARPLFGYGNRQEFMDVINELTQNIDTNTSFDEKLKEQLYGEVEILLSISKYNDVVEMSKHQRKAYALLGGCSKMLSNINPWSYGSPSILILYHHEKGKLLEEVADMYESMPHYYKVSNGHGMGSEYLMDAERRYLINDFISAELLSHKAIFSAQSNNQISVLLGALFLQSKISYCRGDAKGSINAMDKMRDVVKDYEYTIYSHTVDACNAYLCGLANSTLNIDEWLKDGDFSSSRILFPSKCFLNIVFGKIMILRGEYARMLGAVDSFLSVANVFSNVLSYIYTYLYQAIANEGVKNIDGALKSLGLAIELAVTDKILMPFVENGVYIERLLLKIAEDDSFSQFANDVLNIYHDKCILLQKSEKAYNSTGLEALTKREREIAELVAAGMSNGEIAQKLYVAEVTVKKTLKKIYDKFNISKRYDLIRLMRST